MIKKLVKFCKTTICESPKFFILNLIFLLVLVFLQLGMSYAFKLLTEVLVNGTGLANRMYVIFPILLFLICITFGGNPGNFMNMMKMLYTKKAKKLYYKKFLHKAYHSKQDDFYVKDFYDQYEYIKNHINDTTELSEVVFTDFLYAILNTIVVSISISIFSPIIFVYIFIVSITMSLINTYVVKKRIELNDKYVNEERSMGYYDKLFLDKGAAKEIRIYSLKERLLSLWSLKYKNVNLEKCILEEKLKILAYVPNIIQNIFSYALIIYFAYGVFSGTIEISEFVFLYNIMWSLTNSITSIISIISGVLFEKLKYVDKYDRFVAEEKILCKGKDVFEFSSLELDNISYQYANQENYAVKNLSMKINKGEIISILGDNGSGKTTLSKIICGLLENYTGNIYYNGENLKDIEKEKYFKKFGIGFQEFAKYSLTLKENVVIGSIEDIDNLEMLNDTILKGNLEPLIKELPQGINTILGKEYDEKGQELSGGQWQKVIISRAYMGLPDILILDEPTASIDPIAEVRLLKYFREIINGRTAVLISHRIGFARLSDRIYIMQHGNIIEQGTHEELIKAKGKYYKLFSEQQKLYESE